MLLLCYVTSYSALLRLLLHHKPMLHSYAMFLGFVFHVMLCYVIVILLSLCWLCWRNVKDMI
jgi:hypothetical protein